MADCRFELRKRGLNEATCRRCDEHYFSESPPDKIRRPCARGGECQLELVRRGLNEYRCPVCHAVVYDRKIPKRQCGEAVSVESAAATTPSAPPSRPRGGPGTEAKLLLESLRISPLLGCDCEGYARQMDEWGVDGCRQRFDEIVAHFREYAARYDWKTKLMAAALAIKTGLAIKLNPLDPAPGIVEEAIRRAEAGPRPRLGIMTPAMGYGGTERWIVELIQCLRGEWECEVGVLQEHQAYKIPAVEAMRELCPVSILKAAEFPAWCQRFDVLKAWGLIELPQLVAGYKGPVVAVAHGEDLIWTKRWVDHARSAATHWVAVSKAAVTPLVNIPKSRITVIYNAVDAERCKPTRPREETRAALGFSPTEYVVGYLGRLSLEKRVPTVADAVGLLGGDYRGFVVGEGNQRGNIQTYGGRVVLHPQTLAIGDMLAAMDCHVGICDAEGFWRVGIEAGIAGVPLVSTRVGILREIAEERGILWEEVPIGVSAEGVAEAVQRLRASGGNPDRTKRMQAAAGEYSMERFGREWMDLLGRLVRA